MTKSLDTSQFVLDTAGMRGVSTAQAAKLVGVTTRTLFRWLDSGLLPEPKRMKMPGQLWRLWSAKDIARAQKLKGKIRRGPRSRKK
jgi:DNA-binding transcriptional MerR regulator